MKPLRIVHTESSLGWGGQEIRILSEAQGMLQRGHEVRLLCPPDARIFAEAPRFGVPVEALPIARKRMGGVAALVGWFRDHPCDVVNTHSSTDSWLAALAMLIMGRPAPIIRTRHISARVPRNGMTRWLYGSAAARIVTTGEALKDQLVGENGIAAEKIESVPTGIDATRFAPGDRQAARAGLGLPGEKTLIGIVATLRSWKGHRYLIEALVGLPEQFELVIVGDGPQKGALDALIASLGLRDRVHMAGNREDVLPWLQALDIFVLPSYANEGVPQALVQAMLVGLPCVTTSAGSIGEIAKDGETALVVEAQQVPALRDAIRRIASEPALGLRLGAAARTLCTEKYSRERMLSRMEGVFRSVVTGGGA